MLKKLFNRSNTNAGAGSLSIERGRTGIWRSFLRDKRANTAMIVAASLIPMVAMMGAGVDMARSYTARVQLQQACDASAIAARRTMTNGTLTSTNVADALKIFNFNFPQLTAGTTPFTPSISISPNSTSTVVVSVKTTVPTTMMKMFTVNNLPLSVKCEATLTVPNNDVMFVLDTTGSMNTLISDGAGGTTTRLASLKLATKAFYDVLGPGNDNDGRVRYGFVPYVQTVNVGYLLKPEWLKEYGTYSTRLRASTGVVTYGESALLTTGYKTGNDTLNPVYWSDSNTDSAGVSFKQYTNWGGCVEERNTINTITDTSPLNIPSNAYDLNIDLIPYSDETRWQAYWPEVTFWRGGYAASNTSDGFTISSSTSLDVLSYAVCPRKARKLLSYSSRTAAPLGDSSGLGSFDTYINSLTAFGGTYTDVGLMWGARLLSETGLFASENASAPNGFTINRNIVLMTDGAIAANQNTYSAYGINNQNQRIAPTGTSDATLTAIHNRRFEMICNAVKAKGITIWVVAFDTALTPQLANCATSANHASVVTNTITLREQFKSIARNIGGLRVSS